MPVFILTLLFTTAYIVSTEAAETKNFPPSQQDLKSKESIIPNQEETKEHLSTSSSQETKETPVDKDNKKVVCPYIQNDDD